MLSRTANSLFWVGRHVERMEYVARLIDVAQHMSNVSAPSAVIEWHSAIIAAGCEAPFLEKHGQVTAEAVVGYLAFDTDNPSSIVSCMQTARRNARAVRTAISSDAWDAINSTHIEGRGLGSDGFDLDDLSSTLDWVKMRALLINGAYNNTMLRGQAFDFLRLGCFLERADNTARILDVKYHILLPTYEKVGGLVDFYQWAAMLRAVSARRAYHVLYKDRVRPLNVAELLILRQEMPRSVRSCLEQVTLTLDRLADSHSGRGGECHRLAGSMHAGLRYGRIDDVFQFGLHEFLTDHINRLTILGQEIESYYLN